MCTKGNQGSWLTPKNGHPLIDTPDRHLVWHFLNTPWTSESLESRVRINSFSIGAYESVDTQPIIDLLLTECQSSVNQDVDQVLIKCWSRVNGVSNKMLITCWSRVSTNTWPQMPLVHMTGLILLGTNLLPSQHCFFLPVPPNLIMSLQDLHFPQSGCWHTSHTPHLFLRGALVSFPSIWFLKKMSNMCRTRGVVVAWNISDAKFTSGQ